MSQSLEHIESYFQGRMNPIEAREFERSIETDPEFAKEVAFYMSSVATVKDQLNAEKKVRFRQIYDSSKMMVADQLAPSSSRGAVVRKIWKYAMAAAVFSAVLVSAYFYTANPSPREMAESYISNELSDPGVLMSINVGDSIETARQYYIDGNYSEALKISEQVLISNPFNSEALELAGTSALQTNNYEKAITTFQRLARISGLVVNKGNFYTAVTLMKRNQPGDNERAKAILETIVKNDPDHRKQAEAWLKNW